MRPHAALSGLLALLVAIGVGARDLSAADFDWRATLTTDRSEGLHHSGILRKDAPQEECNHSDPKHRRDEDRADAVGDALDRVLRKQLEAAAMHSGKHHNSPACVDRLDDMRCEI